MCCAHEYTLSNLRFAVAVEPGNADLLRYQARCVDLRERDMPTVPSTIEIERRINPFLRTGSDEVIASVRRQSPNARTQVEVFAALREWKNNFR